MTCECGAHKTYKAPPKSTLHSDWCVDSPVYKPKAKVYNAKDILVTFGGFPITGVHNILYGVGVRGAGVLPPPKVNVPCSLGCKQSATVPTFAEVKVDYPNDPVWGSFAGTTKYFCGGCSVPANRCNLINSGCTVTTL